MIVNAFEDHEHWNAVKEVCSRLGGAGYQALLAGGSVRDLLMNRAPNDFDIATDATPDQVESLFPRSIAVGKAFGVIVLPFTGPNSGFQIEVATFREDLEYKDGRRPDGVKFSDAREDAKRRDFTVNALFFDPLKKQVIDYVEGRKDIDAKILRTVGNPNHRFDEDKLRLLRAVRFAAQLDFSIEPNTLQAIIDRADDVGAVSKERIRDEVLKLLKTPSRVTGLSLLLSTGLLSSSVPESAPFILKHETSWITQFEVLSGAKLSDAVLLSLFFLPVFQETGEADFRDRHLKSLRLDNSLSNEIVFLLKHLKAALAPSKVRRGEMAKTLLDVKGKHLIELADWVEKSAPEGLEIESDRGHWLNEVMTTAQKQPNAFLNGSDVKAHGIDAGPKMGEVLNEAHLLQLEGNLKTREEALAWLKGRS
ncbi:MAG: CCA tRNA nucleotidyltransferase [Bdellovibrionota bacterium]